VLEVPSRGVRNDGWRGLKEPQRWGGCEKGNGKSIITVAGENLFRNKLSEEKSSTEKKVSESEKKENRISP